MLARQPLPRFSSPFIGRESEITYITEMLGDKHCRLLTLVGPGGIGKTRLAIEVAERCVHAFADGISFVQLQQVESSEQVIHTLASGVGLVPENAHEPRAQLVNQLRDQTLLLFLDNFEHLLDSVDLISEILAAAPLLKIIATSREALNLRDEWLVPVEGLQLPDDQQAGTLETFSAIQLFVACARRIRPDFSLSGQELAVLRLCRLLGGVPLALELAASWVRALSVDEIIAQVGHNVDFLSARWRDMPARHQSMRAVFDASWQWLSEQQQAAFQSLAVFRGGFTAEAAVYVAQASLAEITALIDKSLVQVDKNGRYDLHELLRQYAFEKLELAVEHREDVLDRHCEYYTDLFHRREPSVHLSDQVMLLADMDNARAAWLRAVQQRNRVALERAAPAMHWLLHFQARHDEGVELFYLAEQAFAHASETEDGRYISAVMPLFRAFFRPERLQEGHFPAVDIDAALAAWETLDERREMGLPLSRAMLALANRGAELSQVIALARKSLAFSRRHGDRSGEAIALATLGSISFAYHGDFEEAQQLLEAALTIDHQIEFHLNARWVEGMLGTLATMRGRYEEARDHFAASVEHHRAGNITRFLDLRLFQMGEAELELGNYAVAVQHFAESRTIAERLQRHAQVAEVLTGYGLAAAYTGDEAAASTYYRQSLNYLEAHGLDITSADIDPLSIGLLALLLGDFRRAHTLFDTITSDVGARRDRVLMMRCHCRLGYAFLGLGDEERARLALFSALRDAVAYGAVSVLLETLVGIAQLSRLAPEAAVVLLSHVRKHPAANRFSRSRADECLSFYKEKLDANAFAAAVKRGEVLSTDAIVALVEPADPGIRPDQADANRDLIEPLSRRELEVLVLIAEGLTNREIADQMYVGVSTIKKHINHIYGKLDVSDRTSAVKRAKALRLIS